MQAENLVYLLSEIFGRASLKLKQTTDGSGISQRLNEIWFPERKIIFVDPNKLSGRVDIMNAPDIVTYSTGPVKSCGFLQGFNVMRQILSLKQD